jgi:hypothetical protein
MVTDKMHGKGTKAFSPQRHFPQRFQLGVQLSAGEVYETRGEKYNSWYDGFTQAVSIGIIGLHTNGVSFC